MEEREEKNIKTMQLYNHIDRVEAELLALQRNSLTETNQDATLLSVDLLSQVDSLHYLGNEAVRSAIQYTHIDDQSEVLDIGSGLGGPARVLVHWTHCRVHAIELQRELSLKAQEFTQRCGLSKHIKHIHGDFLELPIRANAFDAIVSWLVFLHIPNRKKLLQRCIDSLKPGGYIYVEDYFARGEFSKEEKKKLQQDVYVSHLPSLEETLRDLNQAGFTDIAHVDMTKVWSEYVISRSQNFRDNMHRHIQTIGERSAHDLDHFYASVASLFSSGNLGGLLYFARKPKGEEIKV